MKKKNVIVLGNGLVGSVIALDLAEDEGYEVVVCDLNQESLPLASTRLNISAARRPQQSASWRNSGEGASRFCSRRRP
ncbi:MAG: hypothetical protein LBS45_09010 [Synergistaceae bacterium]|jgi:3-hydroxyacyl-CoA dehydrogenase|nr:hypothetical protein [Synergistaceae bacterium]